MDKLSEFVSSLRTAVGNDNQLTVEEARNVISQINEFLYTNYPDIGTVEMLGRKYDYLSDFHIYWEKKHKEILDCRIDDAKCELVADALHDVFLKTNGRVFAELYDTCYLSAEEICAVRFFTANQDFRGSRKFAEHAEIYKDDPTVFSPEKIFSDPEGFVKSIKVEKLSQNDKRITYAKKAAQFLLNRKCEPFDLLAYYKNDVYALRKDLIDAVGAGYGNKKADMFIRDMVVLGVWQNVKGFDKIDVASDVNTIKVALRTGIIRTAIPLVSSFLDIFGCQYAYIDEVNPKAWRRVWEIWQKKYPDNCVNSPSLMDYFVYNIIGKEICRENLYVFLCETGKHTFKWHSSRNKTCQVCARKGIKTRKAEIIERRMACTDSDAEIVVSSLDSLKAFPEEQRPKNCPFVAICNSNRKLEPPKSISILGQTGWTTAYTRKGDGGGWLMF